MAIVTINKLELNHEHQPLG